MSRSNMRGSVASFVVVGAVLAALLLGGIYVVKTQLTGNVQDDAVEVAVDTATKDTTDEANDVKNTNDEQAVEKTDTAKEDAKTQDADAGTDTTTSNDADVKDDSDVAVTNEDSDEAAVSQDDNEEEMPVTGVSTDELPKTGPTETLGMLASFGLIAGAIAYYRRSLRAKA